MVIILETVVALFAAYGLVFFVWWLIALTRARTLSATLLSQVHIAQDHAYFTWLNYAGIFPPTHTNEETDGTRIDDN